MTQEPTCYDNSDEQVSTFSTSKEAALKSQAFHLYDPKVNGQQGYCSSAKVRFTRPCQGGTQCPVKDNCSQTFPLKHYGCEEQGKRESLESSISIRDVCLNLSESDQAEANFINFKSSKEENTNARVNNDGYSENMPFIDDNVSSAEPSISTGSNSLVKQFKSQVPTILPPSLTTISPAHMACDSTQRNCFSVSPDSNDFPVKAKTNFFIKPYQSNPYKCAPLFGLRDFATPVISHSICSESIVSCKKYDQFFPDSQISKHSQPISDSVQTGSEFRTFSPKTLDSECAEVFLEDDFHDGGPPSLDSPSRCGCLNRTLSTESDSSQCSFSFLELFFSGPVRTQLMSQYCDYFLQYSGGKPTSRNSANASSPFNGRLGEESAYTQRVEKGHLFTSDVLTAKNHMHDMKGIHNEEKQNPLSSGHCHQVRFVSPEPVKTKKEMIPSFLDFGFFDLNQSSKHVPTAGKLENTSMNIRQSSSEEKDFRNYKTLFSNETFPIFEQLPKAVVFELVKRPKYILEFPNKTTTISKLQNTTNRHCNYTLFKDNMEKFGQFQKLNDDICEENNFEKRQVSPYMTFGHIKSQHCNYYLHYAEGAGVSPPSTLSDVDYAGHSLEESVVSDKQRSFCSCRSTGQINTQHCDYYIKYRKGIPTSLLSTKLDTENFRTCQEERFDGTSSDFPDSHTLQIENNNINTTLLSYSKTERPLTYADVVRGITHK